MARRKKEDAQLTRDAILDAAEHVFRDKGVARTRMEDIAAGANCTRGAIYWHFKNKVDVLLAMFDRVSLPLYDSMNQIIASQPVNPVEAWRSHLRRSMAKIEQDIQQQTVCDILMNRCELGSDLALLRENEQQRSNFFINSTLQILEQAKANGTIRENANLTLASLSIHAMVTGLIRLWLRQSGNFPLEKTVDESLDLFLLSICK